MNAKDIEICERVYAVLHTLSIKTNKDIELVAIENTWMYTYEELGWIAANKPFDNEKYLRYNKLKAFL